MSEARVAAGGLQARLDEAVTALAHACGARAKPEYPLAPLTSFRVGGPAAILVEAESDEDLAAVADAVARWSLPWFVIGKGSNVLVADRGFAGVVVRLGRSYRWAGQDGVRLRAGAATPLPALANEALARQLSGIEFGVAIPGSVGGAVRMNAGAHGRSMSDVLENVTVYRLTPRARTTIAASDAGFSYRRSALPTDGVVVGVTVALRDASAESIRALMDEARRWRRETQPLAEANCGSVFKNPPGDHAARLIEAVGAKGLAVGGASVSRKHANFIVAEPGARASDVRALIERVRRIVAERSAVELEPEVQFVGDFDDATA